MECAIPLTPVRRWAVDSSPTWGPRRKI